MCVGICVCVLVGVCVQVKNVSYGHVHIDNCHGNYSELHLAYMDECLVPLMWSCWKCCLPTIPWQLSLLSGDQPFPVLFTTQPTVTIMTTMLTTTTTKKPPIQPPMIAGKEAATSLLAAGVGVDVELGVTVGAVVGIITGNMGSELEMIVYMIASSPGPISILNCRDGQ